MVPLGLGGGTILKRRCRSLDGTPTPDWKLEFVVRGGFVSSSQSTSGQRGYVGTSVDTQLSGTVTYNGFNGFQPYVAMLINAPTGRSALYGTSRFARMDGDLVDQGTYGEGWNFGPTAGVSIPLTTGATVHLVGRLYRAERLQQGRLRHIHRSGYRNRSRQERR